MKLRSILAVVAGYVALVVIFFTLVILMGQFWPALKEAAGIFAAQGRYDVFDMSMLVVFQCTWLVANGTAGLVTRLISKRQAEVWCLAALLFAYFAYNHLWAVWDQLPVWYNLLVVVLVVPMVLVGSRAAQLIGGRRQI
jgi:hypothetical protein